MLCFDTFSKSLTRKVCGFDSDYLADRQPCYHPRTSQVQRVKPHFTQFVHFENSWEHDLGDTKSVNYLLVPSRREAVPNKAIEEVRQ